MCKNSYDYIICGAGCAGLTFLYEIIPFVIANNKKILIVDNNKKIENDRTWCFWEEGENLFESIVYHHWNKLEFKSNDFKNSYSITPLKYKMIRGTDFYMHIFEYAKNFDNVNFLIEDVLEISNSHNHINVKTSSKNYTANYVFNSIVFDKQKLVTKNSLLQHFKGIVIETEEDIFDASKATFMDFSIHQNRGTSFMYVLPTSANTALVEYTLFTKMILKKDEYDIELKNYITDTLKINSYKIVHTEFGTIPMTDYNFPSHSGNIINIGTAAGCVKASSGFAFKAIQQHTKQIVDLLISGKKPIVKRTFTDKKFHLYDSVLLEVLTQNKMSGDALFKGIFKKNNPQRVLRFLDNKTNLWDDFKIMMSVPSKIFLPIALKKIFLRK